MAQATRIRELFAKDVTRPIAPVVYFHEDDPAKLHTEVHEYIVTGGYEGKDPRVLRASLFSVLRTEQGQSRH